MRKTLILVVAASLAMLVARPALSAGVCYDLYMPVCGLVKPTGSHTFSNACWAKMAHAPILHSGACVGDGDKSCAFVPPVCAKAPSAHSPKTYDSLCWAEKDWATLIHTGACP
jgi:hypothetical protein